jgi:hypothetical protein
MAAAGGRQTLVAISLIVVAALLSTWIHARGELGPMVTFGRSDANIAARDAWLQLPLYLALIVGAVAGASLAGMLLRVAIVALGGALATWALFLTFAAIGNVKRGPGYAGIGSALCLLALDVIIIGLVAEPLWRAIDRQTERRPEPRAGA